MKTALNSPAADQLPTRQTSSRRWLTLLAALLIFAAGLASGIGLTVLIVVQRLQHAIHHPEEAPARIAARLDQRLGLDDKQAAQVEALIAKRQLELAAIRSKFQPEVAEQLEQLRQEIDGLLTADQREEWTKLFKQFQERWFRAAPAR